MKMLSVTVSGIRKKRTEMEENDKYRNRVFEGMVPSEESGKVPDMGRLCRAVKRSVVGACMILSCSFASFGLDRDTLYERFVSPPAEARPFVRWWWNGDQVTKNELARELDVLHEAGIGGVEINPIGMPAWSKDIGGHSLEWLGREWCEMVAFVSGEAAERGMVTDMIVGSGWPFGGEFLDDGQINQRVTVHRIPCEGGCRIDFGAEDFLRLAADARKGRSSRQGKSRQVLFVELVPKGVREASQVVDLTKAFNRSGRLVTVVPEGEYDLVWGVLHTGVRKVTHGAPGASGYVMDHYRREVTLAYLERLSAISRYTGLPLNRLLRALFCDSIELAGANWTPGMDRIFEKRYGYPLTPYLPFVFAAASYTGGYPADDCSEGFRDTLRRVRFDFNNLLVEVLLENFSQTFQDFCSRHGVLCRLQSYGAPWLPGLMRGNMIPDIPESNNWIYTTDMTASHWDWNKRHGYMIWNLYASAAGNLTGRSIVSCESMTNTAGVFMTSLDEIKLHDDMNFITGINHSVLHGYNYSPPEAGFPGWIRYGTWFSERNPWWPYFPLWVDYNARLSYLFQHSRSRKTFAILPPQGDVWSDYGLARTPFQVRPWYCFQLWEALSRCGTSCDYIAENIVQGADTKNGKLAFGPMNYEVVVLCDVQSVAPATARALSDFVRNGGTLVVVGRIPSRSLSMTDVPRGDAEVRRLFAELEADFPDRFVVTAPPRDKDHLSDWTAALMERTGVQPDVRMPDAGHVYQMRKCVDGRDIYFFVNADRVRTADFVAEFPLEGKTPWIWCPETGKRSVYPHDGNRLSIVLKPSGSLLLVFEQGHTEGPAYGPISVAGERIATLDGTWKVRFDPLGGEDFEMDFDRLPDLSLSDDLRLKGFAGTAVYETRFDAPAETRYIDLGSVNKGVTEVFLNGRRVGVNWYGRPVFDVSGMLKEKSNILRVKYVSVVNNYCKTLVGDATAMKWSGRNPWLPNGLTGPVSLRR